MRQSLEIVEKSYGYPGIISEIWSGPLSIVAWRAQSNTIGVKKCKQQNHDFLLPFVSPVIFTAHVCKEREEPVNDHFLPLVYIKFLGPFNL